MKRGQSRNLVIISKLRYYGTDPFFGPNVYCYVSCNPITSFDAYGLRTYFVNGTFNRNGEWIDYSSEAIASYMESMGDTSGDFKIIDWRGENNEGDRSQAASDLAKSVDDFRSENPDEPVNVVGYCHGGNVVIEAANKGAKFDNSVTVATPARNDYQPSDPSSMGNWVNVYSKLDAVQKAGGEWQKAGLAGRIFNGATNVKVSQSAADIAGAVVSPLIKGVKEHIDMQNKKGPEALAVHVQNNQETKKEEEEEEEVVVPEEEKPASSN